MEKAKVSIVVVAHNHEDVLKDCLNSLQSQSLTDLQIIVIDNGSTDNSKKLIEEYSNSHKNFQSVSIDFTAKNKARNIGLQEANGEFIAFIDADDIVNSSSYEKLYDGATKANAEIALGNIQLFNGTRKWEHHDLKSIFKKDLPQIRQFDQQPELLLNPSIKNMMIKRSLLSDNQIQFNENITEQQDLLFTQQSFICSNKVYVTSDIVINVRDLTNSDVIKQTSTLDFFNDLLITQSELRNYYKQKDVTSHYAHIEKKLWDYYLTSLLTKAYYFPSEQFDELLTISSNFANNMSENQIEHNTSKISKVFYTIFVNKVSEEFNLLMRLLSDRTLQKGAVKIEGKYYHYFAKYFPKYKEYLEIKAFNLYQKIEILSLREDRLQVGGFAFIEEINNDDSIKEIQFTNKSNGQVITVTLETLERSDLSYLFSKNSINYNDGGYKTTTIELSKILPDGDYEVSISVKVGDITLKKPLHIFYFSTKANSKPATTKTHSIVPYFPKKNLHIRIKKTGLLGRLKTKIQKSFRDLVYEFGLLVLRREWKSFLIFFLYRLTQKHYRNKHIWLIGERKDTAQDNSYHLFKYIQKNNLRENCYYLIDKNAKDYEHIKEFGNIVQYGSIKHTLYLLTCDKTINAYSERANMYTHEYLQVLKCHPEWQQNQKILIQHGVIGVSRVNHVLNKNRMGYSLFIVSSDFEKDHIVNEFGYAENEVAVTGLARWDALENTGNGKTILIMPTWRNWNKSTQQLMNSEYFNRYLSLLSNPDLHQILEDNDLNIIFYPHYQTQVYMKDVPDFHKRIKVIRQGEETVQSLLKRSDLLITDYSTVSFDFSYMEKPVIFYQFDYRRFYYEHYNQGPITQELLFGEVVSEEEQVLNGIKKFANKDQQFLENTVENPFVIKTSKQHAKLNYEAIANR
ncbi:CDP-glycerol:glycerophosphate glycerophosphotransferase [Bacillus sp. AFS017336]|uniref:CDP-glycerol:glycerophosphate glycerophosphotransferase n=1 Tax=Bacillus sp. AFS017336 TaxID=2033489 RepID=UPI000BEFE38F|nr:CDP-glycerol glycerophosphotransferase family protein [Bacillus sp. AFS017336]PEL13517.1 teichoic acid biosynthesis protein B [Bacillus sp. AFS017336]